METRRNKAEIPSVKEQLGNIGDLAALVFAAGLMLVIIYILTGEIADYLIKNNNKDPFDAAAMAWAVAALLVFVAALDTKDDVARTAGKYFFISVLIIMQVYFAGTNSAAPILAEKGKTAGPSPMQVDAMAEIKKSLGDFDATAEMIDGRVEKLPASHHTNGAKLADGKVDVLKTKADLLETYAELAKTEPAAAPDGIEKAILETSVYASFSYRFALEFGLVILGSFFGRRLRRLLTAPADEPEPEHGDTKPEADPEPGGLETLQAAPEPEGFYPASRELVADIEKAKKGKVMTPKEENRFLGMTPKAFLGIKFDNLVCKARNGGRKGPYDVYSGNVLLGTGPNNSMAYENAAIKHMAAIMDAYLAKQARRREG